MAIRVIERKANSKGVPFALGHDDSGYLVIKLSSNYDGSVYGGIRKKWVVVDQKMELEAARKLFDRRSSK